MNRLCFILLVLAFCAGVFLAQGASADRPNILFCFSDDQSWPHASAYGEPVIKTPVFDRVAREGVLFTHAYCGAPSCTPSRSAVLTGQQIWRLGEGGQLFGTLPAKHPVYTRCWRKRAITLATWRRDGGPADSTRAATVRIRPASPTRISNHSPTRPRDALVFLVW